MRFWEWYQRLVLTIIALSLVLLVLRLYAPLGFTTYLARHRMLGVLYVRGGVTVDGSVEVTNIIPLQVEVTNTPVEVEIVR